MRLSANGKDWLAIWGAGLYWLLILIPLLAFLAYDLLLWLLA